MGKFKVTGWVNVEIYVTVTARNIEEVKKKLANASNLIFEQGNWVSDPEIEEIREVKE